MKKACAVVTLFTLANLASHVGLAAEQSEDSGTQYLYIQELVVPAGGTISAAVDEGRQWVKTMRSTGDFKNVRLFLHHTGPEAAIYILAEPESWASIESGFETTLEKLDVMNKPFNWAKHSDNVLSEIPVE